LLSPSVVTAARNPALSAGTVRCYCVLIEELDFRIARPLKVAWVARQAHVSPSHASRALRLLAARCYLANGSRDGRLQCYRLYWTPNPGSR
jgi:AraC-like DNA-binding protein